MWARPPCFATLANGGKAPSRLLAKPRSHRRHLFARLSAMKTVVEEIEAHIARVGTHPVYGYAHCLRVFALAEELAASEGVSYDVEILRAAALLHDVGLYKAYALREPPDHAKRSAMVASRILQDWDFLEDLRDSTAKLKLL